jgi:hypothetical protein
VVTDYGDQARPADGAGVTEVPLRAAGFDTAHWK